MKKADKIYNWLNDKIGIRNAFLILVFVVIAAYGYNKKIDLDRKQALTQGVSLGIKKGVKGNLRLHYEFKVEGKHYNGRVPASFCQGSNKDFCDSGNVVFVKFQYDNPENNTLVDQEP